MDPKSPNPHNSNQKPLNKFFLYRYRFIIGYILLGLSFLTLCFTMPFYAPQGLSEAEKVSVVTSYNLHFSSLTSGTLVDLPYHVLQKICILLFGMTPFAIKLPSIIFGLALGFLFVLLLNRWFKNNVALLASVLIVLSIPFLYLSGSGTPLIMLVFWPTLLLWLGSKMQGGEKIHREKRPSIPATFFFALALTLSIYTPHLIYLVIFIITFAILNPHLRFTIKTLPKPHLIAAAILALLGIATWLINLFSNPTSAQEIFLAKDFAFANLIPNIKLGFAPFFSWTTALESVYLSPLFNISLVVLAVLGLFATRQDFLASRNAIASCFLLFVLALTALNPDSALLLTLPFAILIAHGLKYLIEKWYTLFPENPYARIFALIPLSVLILTILIPTLSYYIIGYNYSPAVANNFSEDLALVSQSLPDQTPLLVASGANTLDYDFFAVYEDRTHKIDLVNDFNNLQSLAILKNTEIIPELPETYILAQIITSPKSEESDRIYLYKLKNS